MENIVFGLGANVLVIGFGIGMIILLIWNVIISVKLKKASSRFNGILSGSTAVSVEGAYLENVSRAEKAAARVIEMEVKLEELRIQLEGCVQKIDIIRYNAFSDSGSDLSYSLALLNNKNDGLLLTGIYGRNESYTYAKPIKAGKSTYALSEEEIQVLSKVR